MQLLAMSAALFKSIFKSRDTWHDVNYSDATFLLKECKKFFYFVVLLNQRPIFHCNGHNTQNPGD